MLVWHQIPFFWHQNCFFSTKNISLALKLFFWHQNFLNWHQILFFGTKNISFSTITILSNTNHFYFALNTRFYLPCPTIIPTSPLQRPARTRCPENEVR